VEEGVLAKNAACNLGKTFFPHGANIANRAKQASWVLVAVTPVPDGLSIFCTALLARWDHSYSSSPKDIVEMPWIDFNVAD
jgi:hypothetical protein